MALIVQKYGGTSVGSVERIKKVAERIKSYVNDGHKLVVVVSAMGDTTDELIEMARQISTNPSKREMDMLLATGEQVSIALVSMALHELGIKSISLTGPQAGMITTKVFSKGRIKHIDPKRIFSELEKNDVVVVAGFQGISEDNEDIVTLGRGGSDLSAVAIAASIKADKCEIFTDVDGVYTTDPRIVPNAKKIDRISYDEMLELASLGAGVMQSRSIEVAKKFNIDLVVRNSFNNNEGTLITKEDESMEDVLVRGVARDLSESKVTLVGVIDKPGVAAEIFKKLYEKNINVDMIIQNVSSNGKTDLSFTVKKDDLQDAIKILEPMKEEVGFDDITYDENIAKVSIVGVGMKSHSGVAYKMFQILAENGINIEMISTSEIKISVVIDADKSELAVRKLHEAFELDK